MASLFTNVSIIQSTMREARKRRLKSNTEKVVTKIQKEIDYAAERGRSEILIYTGDFYLAVCEREAITHNLQEAGYKHRWRSCNKEDERIHIWWEDEND